MADLSTTYLGLSLKNPVVASASPISKKLDGIKKLEDAGAILQHHANKSRRSVGLVMIRGHSAGHTGETFVAGRQPEVAARIAVGPPHLLGQTPAAHEIIRAPAIQPPQPFASQPDAALRIHAHRFNQIPVIGATLQLAIRPRQNAHR